MPDKAQQIAERILVAVRGQAGRDHGALAANILREEIRPLLDAGEIALKALRNERGGVSIGTAMTLMEFKEQLAEWRTP